MALFHSAARSNSRLPNQLKLIQSCNFPDTYSCPFTHEESSTYAACAQTLRDFIQLTTTVPEKKKTNNNTFGHSFSTISGFCWIEVTVCLPLLYILPTTSANTRGYQSKLTFLHKKFLPPQIELWSCFFEHCFSQN